MNHSEILERDGYTCQKCSYKNVQAKGLQAHQIDPKYKSEDKIPDSNLITLCDICSHYAPKEPKYFKKYLNEKIDGRILDTFRNAALTISDKTRQGMMRKQNAGEIISKPPKGYRLVDKKLVMEPIQADIIRRLFEEYTSTDSSLNRLAQKYGLSTPGMIKILKNPVYTGMMRTKDGDIKGNHEPIITQELFEKVQEKLGSSKKDINAA